MAANPVLLVEDDEDLRTTLAEVLRDQGLHVAEAANGLEALDWLSSHAPPALVLLDLMMPKMDGMEFRAAQLADPAISGVPVVFMTASTAGKQAVEATGAAGLLRKPLAVDELLGVVHRFVPVPGP